ncbi:MAG: hypothetical protein ACF788_00220 [Novipirellula sp. JB048]
MNVIEPTSSRSAKASQCVAESYRFALWWVLAAWLVGLVVSVVAVGVQDWGRVGDASFVAVMSGVIALLSMLPGLRLSGASMFSNQQVGEATAAVTAASREEMAMVRFSGFLLASGMGMIFRLFGTVALFLFCRYQLAETTEWVAGFTIGWYAFLTTVEVGVLAYRRNQTVTSRCCF